MKIYNSLIFLFLLLCCYCFSQPVVQTGLDNISEYYYLFKGKRIGIITNHTAYNLQNEHITDIFLQMPGIKISALFGPEHGIRGDVAAGGKIEDEQDPLRNIPIYSLYGKNKKPTAEMLGDIDMLVFDIQDIGVRYYTYISTMSLAMEAAAENNIPFVVLDRPNPLNGRHIEGNILEPAFASFVGLHPIPVRHGMTVGELAEMINHEKWLKEGVQVELEVIPLTNWQRHMWFDQTGLNWRAPSPNMPSLQVAAVYPGTCLFEGTNISEGRGTYKPFLKIGAPWLIPDQIDKILRKFNRPEIRLDPITFMPRSIASMSPNPKYLGSELNGISISVADRDKFKSYLFGIKLVKHFYEADKKKFVWRQKHFDRLCGTSKIREMIIEGIEIQEIEKWIGLSFASFIKKREKYLKYE